MIQLILLAEVNDDVTGILKWEVEVDEVEHELADRVESYVLGQALRNPQLGLALLFLPAK